MATLRIGNWASDLANALAGLRKGKVEEEDRVTQKDERSRLLALRVDEGERQQRQLELSEDNAARSNERADAELGLRKEDAARTQQDFEAEQRSATDLRSRIQQLDPKYKVDNLSHDDARAVLGMLEHRQTTLRATELAQRKQQSDQLLATRRLQEIANTNLLTIKRTRDDAIKRIQSDPSLMKQYAELIRSKAPEPLREMIRRVSNGRDLDAEYLAAGQQVIQAGQQAFVLGGKAGGVSPATQSAVDKNLPFQMLDPDTQASIAAQVTARLKSGQMIDMAEARSRGIPVEQIAQSSGIALDPLTGAIQAPAAAAAPASPRPANPNAAPTPFGAMSSLLPSMPSIPAQPLPSALNKPGIPTMQGPALFSRAATPYGGGAPQPAGTAGNTIAGPDSPAAVAPASPLARLRAAFTPESIPRTPMPTGMFSPAQPAAPQLAQPGSMEQNGFMALQSAVSMPLAEQAARSLLDNGADFDTVINTIPQSFRPFLSARLPKRLPTSGTQPY